MNFIKQIEASLKAINQARFQDLINHLLHIQGNTFIGAPGSVVAKEKTSKGAPDSFFVDGENYVFVECTTQEKLGNAKTFLEKLIKDIEHCFNLEKTGIEKELIQRIILACNDKIDAKDLKELRAVVLKHNTNTTLEILDIQNLPLHIYDFPGLSEQYVGVNIVKGEIYNLPDFLTKTTKGLQPSLTNYFVGREEEVKDAIEHLQNVDILFLSGAAGVGKSKLAVTILEHIGKKGFIPIVIESSAVPLWDDFVHLFQNGRDYIILFDDANKSVQNLTYLLDFIQKPKTSKLKVIITTRDYVKQQVSQRLNNSRYREIVVDKLKDKDIEEIILKSLPTLQYHLDIKRKIIGLAKGNTRVALMATYSVTPNSETNYLDSPVLLYDKYFEKIASEIEAFSKPITLKALAIVSFFGVLDKNDSDLRSCFELEFGIDWNELWSTILELHKNEVLDVYSNEVVKVSDQVLATYAYYKCFLDLESAEIDYGQWISVFIQKYPQRVKNSLIDVNNTFNYEHIKELVLPHLERVINDETDEETLYSFYSIFWFYKGYETLIYLKEWVKMLPVESNEDELIFSYVHNDHISASKYFELLVPFWDYPNELLKPSLELGIDLVTKQISRLPEFLKFINDYFTYKLFDVQYGYQRQNIFLSVLLSEDRSLLHKKVAKGTLLNISETLLGWRFTEYSPSKGNSISITNFQLYISSDLLELRRRILKGFLTLFEFNNEQSDRILEKIVYPGGDIDKQVYVSELPIYHTIITNKLSVKLYSHCKFVSKLTKKVYNNNDEIPKEWKSYIQSDIIKLSKFLKTEFNDSKEKSWQEREQEKRQEIQESILSKNWSEIELLLSSIDNLYKQQIGRARWQIDYAISEVVIAISKRNKVDIDKALRLFFGRKLSIPLQPRVLNFILNEASLTCKDIYSLINDFDFEAKYFWTVSLLNALPNNQIDIHFVELLIEMFKKASGHLPIHRMADYIKFDETFSLYKRDRPELELGDHNIISYLTEILLQRQDDKSISLGFHFCQDCAQFLTNHVHLLKQAYILLKSNDRDFDYNGKELEAVLKLDNNFFIEYLERRAVGSDYLLFKLEGFKLSYIWSLPNYNDIVNRALKIISEKSPFVSSWEHPAGTLFILENGNDELIKKTYNFIRDFIKINYLNRQRIMIIMNVVLHRFPDQFINCLEQFIRLNKDVEIFKNIYFDKGGIYTGSRVPKIQRVIDLCIDISSMIKTLPDILDYIEHIKYLDQYIGWLKKDITNEQRREFQETYE